MKRYLFRQSTFHLNRRGIALLMVLMMTTLLTIMMVDLSFSTRVSSDITRNYKNELRALYLAKSAIRFSEIFLKLDIQVGAQLNKGLKDLKSAAGASGLGGVQFGGMAPGATHLWDLVPVQYPPPTDMLGALLGVEGTEDTNGDESLKPKLPKTSDDEMFYVEVEDESVKLNINRFYEERNVPGTNLITYDLIYNLMRQEQFDELFKNGDSSLREDLIYALVDWVDPDFESRNPRANRDENHPYYDKGYSVKNAPMFSLDELYLVDGWRDKFYKEFKRFFTVYGDGRINVKAAPKEILMAMFNENVSQKQKEEKTDLLMTARSTVTFSLRDFFSKMAKELQAQKPQDIFLPSLVTKSREYIRVSSQVFTVVATGIKGESQKKITAVYNRGNRMSDETKLLYYHIE